MMTKSVQVVRSLSQGFLRSAVLYPLWILTWPFVQFAKAFYRHFLAYLLGTTVRDKRRVYCVKFVWYGDSVYLHPMVWGSLLLSLAATWELIPAGFVLLAWFVGLFVCFMTIMYNFNVVRSAVLATGLVAFFGLAYFATVELSWNPLLAIASHVAALGAHVSPGFYVASAYLFAALIASELLWAWLFHRVEIDESYIYEHGFLQGSTREPIFARGMKRETKDLLELLLLGAADIQHRTKNGFKRFKNVPFASLWVGTAIDSLLDHRRKGEVDLSTKSDDEAELVRLSDAIAEELDEDDDGFDGDDDSGDDDDIDSEA
jgi:hypothetical protein